MQHHETIIGGGPAGSRCAWQLKKQGKDALILDKQVFPRLKLYAGWDTAKVMEDLEFSPADYPHPISELQVKIHLRWLPWAFSWFPTFSTKMLVEEVHLGGCSFQQKDLLKYI